MVRLERSHLEAFAAVAESGSVAAAANRLHLSPSAVSKSVSHLERMLGAPLFDRTTAGMIRLPLADGVRDSAELVLLMMEKIEARGATSSEGDSSSDPLRVLCASSLVPNPLSDIVQRYVSAHAGRRLILDTLRASELDLIAARVMAGHYDVGITETPREKPSGLAVHGIPDEEVWAVLPPGMGEAIDGEITTDQLVECGLVVGPHWESSAVYRGLVALDSRINGAVRLRTTHRDAFLSFTLAGFGAAFVMAAPMTNLQEVGCAVGRVRGLPTRSICVLHRDPPHTEAISRFVEVCREDVPMDSRVPPALL